MGTAFKVGDVIVNSNDLILKVRDSHTTMGHVQYTLEVLEPGLSGHDEGAILIRPVEVVDYMCKMWGYMPPEDDDKKDEPKKPIVTFYDAYMAEIEAKKPLYSKHQKEWLSEGKCPQCGELGRYHLSTPICSRHGAY